MALYEFNHPGTNFDLVLSDLPVVVMPGTVSAAKASLGNLAVILKKPYRAMTLLLWLVWFFVNFGFTIFNVYLPTFLQARNVSLETSYRDMVLYTLIGIPASVIATALSRIVPKYVAAISTFLCGVSLVLFTVSKSHAMVVISSCIVNLLGVIMVCIFFL